jgi:DNA-directed RNA polymerase subunit RPC12/RpoP
MSGLAEVGSIAVVLFILGVVVITPMMSHQSNDAVDDDVVADEMTNMRCECGGKIIAKVHASGTVERQCTECGLRLWDLT